MTPWKGLALAAVLVALVVFIFKFQIPRDELKTNERLLVKGGQAGSIKRIEIDSKNESFALVNRAPSDSVDKKGSAKGEALKNWELDGVQGATKLDGASINALLMAVTNFILEEPLKAEDLEKDLSVYGLAKPEMRIKIESLNGSKEILFGLKSDFVNQRYAKLADKEDIYLSSEDLFSASSRPRDEFRLKTPIQFDQSDITGLIIEAGGSRTVLQKDDKERWSIAEPYVATADGSHISELLRKLRTLRVQQFIDNPEASSEAYRITKPDSKITLKRKDGNLDIFMSVLSGGDPASLVRTSDTPSVFRISGTLDPDFTIGTNEIREHHLFRFDVESATAFTISVEGTAQLDLTKSLSESDGEPSEKWNINGKEGDAEFAKGYLKRISELEASAFPEAGLSANIVKPVAKISVKLSDGKEQILEIGAREEASNVVRYPALLKGTAELFYISEREFEKLTPREEVFIKSVPSPVPTVTATASPVGP